MIDVNIEFNKGILFVRLIGELNESNEKDLEEQIISMVQEGGVKYIVFNTEDAYINDDISLFEICNELIKSNDGKMILCGKEDNVLAYNYEYVSDELSALNLLTAC